jgi:hypothetical protein
MPSENGSALNCARAMMPGSGKLARPAPRPTLSNVRRLTPRGHDFWIGFMIAARAEVEMTAIIHKSGGTTRAII